MNRIARNALLADGHGRLWAGVLAAMMATTSAGAMAQDQTSTVAGPQRPTSANEIIVTANRREERLQDVPIAVTSISNDTLVDAAITDTSELVRLSPGLRMDGTGVFTSPTIRGVSTNQASVASDPNVATYIDGVYQQFTVGAVYSLPDVVQVQVLKGPQGTLFGRNATGGAILITTRDPELDASAGSFDLSVGRFEEVIAKGYASVPLIDNVLAVSLTGYVNRHDGYYTNVATGEEGGGLLDRLVRGKIRLAPTEGVDLILTGSYNIRRDDDANLLFSGNGSNSTIRDFPDAIPGAGPYEYASEFEPRLTTKTSAGSLRANIEVGPGLLTSTTAYTKVLAPLTFDNDGTNLGVSSVFQNPQSRTFTQELVYATDRMNGFQATFGGFYYRNKARYYVNVLEGATLIDTDERARAWALFGEANYDITDRLRIVGGLRYSREKRTASATLSSFGTLLAEMPYQEKTFDAWTPRASIVFDITPQNNVYATYSKGFKSGLFNGIALQVAPVQPEKLTAYEVGSKNSFGDFTANISAFYYDYSDLQVSNLIQDGNSFIPIVNNAAKSEIYGGELELAYRPNQDFYITAGVSYLHARYSSFPNASVIVPAGTIGGVPVQDALAAGTDICNFGAITPNGLGGVAASCDVEGNSLIRSPDWTGNIAAGYSIPTGPGYVKLSGSAYFTSEIFYDAINRVRQPSYAMFSARIAWQPNADTDFEVALWGKNLSNEHVLTSVFESELADLSRAEMPRTYGVQMRFGF